MKEKNYNIKESETHQNDIKDAIEEKSKSTKKPSKLVYIFLYVAVLAFVAYAVFTLLNIHSQIKSKKDELKDINNQIKVQEIKNDEMNKLYNYTDKEFSDYVEQIARDEFDYVKTGERVFVNVSGD